MPNTKVVGIIFPYILTPIPNLYDHSFPRYGQITFLTFRRPTTLTFDLKFWWSVEKWLRYYTLKFCENTDKHTHKQTHKQTDMGITIPRPPPMGGEVIITFAYSIVCHNRNRCRATCTDNYIVIKYTLLHNTKQTNLIYVMHYITGGLLGPYAIIVHHVMQGRIQDFEQGESMIKNCASPIFSKTTIKVYA